jgi:hypothetical protein
MICRVDVEQGGLIEAFTISENVSSLSKSAVADGTTACLHASKRSPRGPDIIKWGNHSIPIHIKQMCLPPLKPHQRVQHACMVRSSDIYKRHLGTLGTFVAGMPTSYAKYFSLLCGVRSSVWAGIGSHSELTERNLCDRRMIHRTSCYCRERMLYFGCTEFRRGSSSIYEKCLPVSLRSVKGDRISRGNTTPRKTHLVTTPIAWWCWGAVLRSHLIVSCTLVL